MDNISPVYARLVLREIQGRGIPDAQLFEGTSLTGRKLAAVDQIAVEDFLAVLANGSRLCGNEQIGLVIGRHSNIMVLGSLGAAAAIAPTVRAGLQVIENYTRLHISYMRVELASSPRGLSVVLRFSYDTGDTERFHTESAFMLLQHYVETLCGRSLDGAGYTMALPAPDYAEEYARWLHAPVTFNAPRNSAELPTHLLDQPSPYFDAVMWSEATLKLAQLIRELEGEEKTPYTQFVGALLRSSELPLPELADAASRLHMSERTLNRRLQKEGTSFREIRGNTLGSRARQYLDTTDYSVEAIAALLGYQDAANFRRAFRNAEGCSPSEFRQRSGEPRG